MRQKDANLHLAKKRGTGFQKAAQYPEQSNQPDVPTYLFFEKTDTFKLSFLSKAIRRISGYLFIENKSTYLRPLLMRQKDANLHLTKKCGTGFQTA